MEGDGQSERGFARAVTETGAEELLRIAESLPVGLALVDADLVYHYANPAFKRLTSSEDVAGHSVSEVWTGSANEQATLLRRVLATGRAVREDGIERPVRRSPDGRPEPGFFTFRYSRLKGPGEPLVLIQAEETTEETRAAAQARSVFEEVEQTAGALSAVFESMDDGFFTLDREWRFTYLNHRAEQLLHGKRDELLGKSIWVAYPETEDSVFGEQFRRAMVEQTPVSFEEYYPPHDMWAGVHALPTRQGLTVYLSDITNRKETEAALARSEGQLRAFIENSPDVVYIKDLEGRFLRVNEEFARRFQKTKEEVVGKTDDDLLVPANAHQVRANDAQVLAAGEAKQFEEEIPLPGGETIVYLTTKFPLKDSSGRIYAVAGISTNLNDRIRQERELSASEERFRKVFAEGPLGIVLFDPTLAIWQLNDRYAAMMGFSKAELVGKTMAELTLDEDREQTLTLARQLLRGEIPSYHVDRRYRREDGTVFWASVHGTLLKDDRGRPQYLMSLIEDVTQRKNAEEALRDKDQQIREAYSEVLSAVTGGKIVLMTPDEIEEALGEPVSDTWDVRDYADLGGARHSLARVLLELGVESDMIDSYVLAACEAFTNAVKHGGGGEIRVHRHGETVQIAVCDHGPGIDFEHLPRATLLAGFSTAQSLGAGFTIMLELCDRLLLATQHGLTTVVLEGPISRPEPTEGVEILAGQTSGHGGR